MGYWLFACIDYPISITANRFPFLQLRTLYCSLNQIPCFLPQTWQNLSVICGFLCCKWHKL